MRQLGYQSISPVAGLKPSQWVFDCVKTVITSMMGEQNSAIDTATPLGADHLTHAMASSFAEGFRLEPDLRGTGAMVIRLLWRP